MGISGGGGSSGEGNHQRYIQELQKRDAAQAKIEAEFEKLDKKYRQALSEIKKRSQQVGEGDVNNQLAIKDAMIAKLEAENKELDRKYHKYYDYVKSKCQPKKQDSEPKK